MKRLDESMPGDLERARAEFRAALERAVPPAPRPCRDCEGDCDCVLSDRTLSDVRRAS